jgi:hypothetical protein
LSSLVQEGQANYMVTDDNDATYHINICRRLTSVDGCPDGAAVCKVQADGTKLSLGGRKAPEWDVAEQSPMIRYGAGKCSATITLKCPNQWSAATGGPVLSQQVDGCNVAFDWITEAACPVQYTSNIDELTDGGGCKIDGLDFTALRDTQGGKWTVDVEKGVESSSAYKYTFGVCKKLVGGSCCHAVFHLVVAAQASLQERSGVGCWLC